MDRLKFGVVGAVARGSDFAGEFLPDEWLNPMSAPLQAHPGDGDYLVMQDFIRTILEGAPRPIGIHEAMDMTLSALVCQESIVKGGTWLPVPDSREWSG